MRVRILDDVVHRTRLTHVARIYDAVPNFALPLFTELGTEQFPLVQDIDNEGLIRAFMPIELDQGLIYEFKRPLECALGDAALLAFEISEGCFEVGDRSKLITAIRPMVTSDNLLDRPFTRAALAEFCGEIPAVRLANVDAIDRLKSTLRTQAYFRVNVLARDRIKRAFAEAGISSLRKFRINENGPDLLIELPRGTSVDQLFIAEQALRLCESDLAELVDADKPVWRCDVAPPPDAANTSAGMANKYSDKLLVRRAEFEGLTGTDAFENYELEDLIAWIDDLTGALTSRRSRPQVLNDISNLAPRCLNFPSSRPLTASLSRLGRRLRAIGERGFGLEIQRLLVEMYRVQAKANKDPENGLLAAGLSTLANQLMEVGALEEARNTVDESIWLRRKLAERDFHRYASGLAYTLERYSILLRRFGNYQEALNVNNESIEIRKTISRGGRQYLRGLPGTFEIRARLLLDIGDFFAARRAWEEATNARRDLARENRGRYLEPLARALTRFAYVLQRTFRDDREAMDTLYESTEIFRELAEADFKKYSRSLRRNLELLAEHLDRLGDFRSARVFRDQAAATLKIGESP
jgi:hypothetical protein